MSIEVTSASKQEQKLSRVAAAIFVITPDDILRSGATNIPSLLRMVPGITVDQINANTWAISVRGLNEQYSDKLLVLVDGRSVYTPTFGGVYWDTLDIPLEDIERIEVIRGPGGTVWGANAVNGVVNIITKLSSETRGGLVVAAAGNLDEELVTAQYGGALGKKSGYRAYLKYRNEDHLPGLNGAPGGDGWELLSGGFRTDSALTANDKLTTEGTLYSGREGQNLISLAPGVVTREFGGVSGGDLQLAWNHIHSEQSTSTLQISFDRYARTTPFLENRNTLEVSFQHDSRYGERHNVVWSIDYRFTNHNSNSAVITFDPSDNTRQLFSSFAQDEIAIVPDRLYFTLGAKLEHNDYNGFDFLPSARLAWQPSGKQMLWAAVSRSERTPSSADVAHQIENVQIPGPSGVPIQLVLSGNPAFQNEVLLAYEAGYRAVLTRSLSVDFSAYFNSYDDLRTLEMGAPIFVPAPPPAHILQPFAFGNGMNAEAHGLEAMANWKPTARWTLKGGYAFERIHAHHHPLSNDALLSGLAESGSPRHSAQLQSHVSLAHSLVWDTSVDFSGRLPVLNIPTRTRLDTGLTWSCTPKLSLSLFGQNLLRDRELEYLNTTGLSQSTQIKRSTYLKLSWQF